MSSIVSNASKSTKMALVEQEPTVDVDDEQSSSAQTPTATPVKKSKKSIVSVARDNDVSDDSSVEPSTSLSSTSSRKSNRSSKLYAEVPALDDTDRLSDTGSTASASSTKKSTKVKKTVTTAAAPQQEDGSTTTMTVSDNDLESNGASSSSVTKKKTRIRSATLAELQRESEIHIVEVSVCGKRRNDVVLIESLLNHRFPTITSSTVEFDRGSRIDSEILQR
jgi:hypothetical protein